MWNKYRKWHPTKATDYDRSHVWKGLTKIREEVEHQIWWQLRSGEISFWYDNWTRMGALYYLEDQPGEDEIEVKEFIIDNQWNKEKLLSCISAEMTECIVSNISPLLNNQETDRVIWMGNKS